MENENKLIAEAISFIKSQPNELIRRFIDSKIHRSVEHPVSLFMAGSPGAGKTEVSKRLIEQFSEGLPVRIDADDIREIFPNYNGNNSHIFQPACTVGVNKLFDYVLEHKINTILDGTFAYEHALDNISRSINHHRKVIIWYLFQKPEIAWRFTKIREEQEGRRVSKEVFIRSFIQAHENVNKAKFCFKQDVYLNLIIKDFIMETEKIHLDVDNVDKYLEKVYNLNELESVII